MLSIVVYAYLLGIRKHVAQQVREGAFDQQKASVILEDISSMSVKMPLFALNRAAHYLS